MTRLSAKKLQNSDDAGDSSSMTMRAAVLRRGYYGKTNHRLDAQA